MKSTITKNQKGNYVIDISVPRADGSFATFSANSIDSSILMREALEAVIFELKEYEEYCKTVQEAEEKWNNRKK